MVSPALPRTFILTHPAMFWPKSMMYCPLSRRRMLAAGTVDMTFMLGAGVPMSSAMGIEVRSARIQCESS